MIKILHKILLPPKRSAILWIVLSINSIGLGQKFSELGPIEAPSQHIGAIGAIHPLGNINGQHIALCNGFNGSNAIYRTTNYKTTNPLWTRVDGIDNTTIDGPVYTFAQNPNNPNEILALRNSPQHGTRISVSMDAGANWIQTDGIDKNPKVHNAFTWRDVNNGQIGYFGTNVIDKIIFSRLILHPKSNNTNHPKPLIIGLSNNNIYCTNLTKKFKYQNSEWPNILSYMHLPGNLFLDILEDPLHDGWFWVQTNTGIFYLHIFEKPSNKKNSNEIGMDTFLIKNGFPNEILTNLDSNYGVAARNPHLGISKIISSRLSVDNKNDLYITYRVVANKNTSDIIEHVAINVAFNGNIPTIKKTFYTIAQNINANPSLPFANRSIYIFNSINPSIIYFEDPYTRQMKELELNNLQGLSTLINTRDIASDCHQDVRAIVVFNQTTEPDNEIKTQLFVGNDGGISFSPDIKTINLKNINGIGLNIARFWNVGVSQNYPCLILGGAQDGNHFIFNNNKSISYKPGFGDGFKTIFNPFIQINNDNISNPPIFFNMNEYLGSMNPYSNNFLQSGPNNFNRIPYILSSTSKKDSINLISTDAGYNGFQNIHRVTYLTNSNNSSTIIIGNYPDGQASKELNRINPGSGSLIKQFRVHTGHINSMVESKLNPAIQYFTRKSTIWYNIDHIEQVGGVYCINDTSVKDLTGGLMEYSNLNQMNVLTPNSPLSDGASINCIETGTGRIFGLSHIQDIVFIGLTSGILGANVFFCYPENNIEWRNISSGLGSGVTINCLKYDQVNGHLYAGTNEGLFRFDFRRWTIFSSWVKINSIPNISIMDLEIQYNEGILYAASFGGGMFKAPLKHYPKMP